MLFEHLENFHISIFICILDIDIGGILELINRNIQRNLNNIKGRVCTMELDFKKELSEPMIKELEKVELVIAADGENYLSSILLPNFIHIFFC